MSVQALDEKTIADVEKLYADLTKITSTAIEAYGPLAALTANLLSTKHICEALLETGEKTPISETTAAQFRAVIAAVDAIVKFH